MDLKETLKPPQQQTPAAKNPPPSWFYTSRLGKNVNLDTPTGCFPLLRTNEGDVGGAGVGVEDAAPRGCVRGASTLVWHGVLQFCVLHERWQGVQATRMQPGSQGNLGPGMQIRPDCGFGVSVAVDVCQHGLEDQLSMISQ